VARDGSGFIPLRTCYFEHGTTLRPDLAHVGHSLRIRRQHRRYGDDPAGDRLLVERTNAPIDATVRNRLVTDADFLK